MFRFNAFRKFPRFSLNSRLVRPRLNWAFLPLLSLNSKILNDAVAVPNYKQAQVNKPVIPDLKKEFKTLNYNELTVGSIVGTILGVIVGVFSNLILAFAVSGYLLIQYLESRNIIHIPWTYVFTFRNEKMDLNTLFFDRFSFKISFLASFLIAAYNI